MSDTEIRSTNLNLSDLRPDSRYKLLAGVVVPRPIALVTTIAAEGVVNAAPFSFFNVFCEDPPLVILGLQAKDDLSPKDTTANIRRSGEFVINLVGEGIAEKMNICSVDFPSDISELDEAGLTTASSIDIQVPRIAEAPIALECRQKMIISFGPLREILIGEVIRLHAQPGIIDSKNLRTDLNLYRPVGRLSGDKYSRQTDTFNLTRKTLEEWERVGKE